MISMNTGVDWGRRLVNSSESNDGFPTTTALGRTDSRDRMLLLRQARTRGRRAPTGSAGNATGFMRLVGRGRALLNSGAPPRREKSPHLGSRVG